MTTTRRLLVLSLAAMVVAGCSGPAAPSAPEPEPPPPGPAEQALAVYERFWSVAQDAYAAPGARDWTPELAMVASGTALDRVVDDVLNYADFPAHSEGVVSRAPVVAEVTGTTVAIVDCVDLGDSRLVADLTGEVLDDLLNRVPRYTFRADVVLTDGRWLVDRTDAAQEEPC